MQHWLNKTHVGDCRELLRKMADDGVRVQTCVTSPPYFGLRDYGTAMWKGGDANCDHPCTRRNHGDEKQSTSFGTSRDRIIAQDCPQCGAQRIDSQIGLESSPAEYVDTLVSVFRVVRDVLSEDGTLWLNLGDSYANDGKWGGSSGGKHVKALHGNTSIGRGRKTTGAKPKDLLGIPWRVAFALQDDGWYLRSDIIYSKPNPMPESVTDRPTKAHEYLFLLAKSERYYYDAQAIREEAKYPGDHGFLRGPIDGCDSDTVTWRAKSMQTRKMLGVDSKTAGNEWRNRRSVWTVASEPFSGAHFACFPRKLIQPCILAGAPPGGVVLDPFMGSGTTAQVATDLGRNFIGCELNRDYVELHDMRRTTLGMPL
jgi:DNA modification methylase